MIKYISESEQVIAYKKEDNLYFTKLIILKVEQWNFITASIAASFSPDLFICHPTSTLQSFTCSALLLKAWNPSTCLFFSMWWINMKYERWWGSILAEFMILKWQRSLAVWVLQRIWMSSWPVILMRFFHQSTTPGLATARAFTAIYLTERRLLCVVLSVFSPLQFSITHFVMLILVVSLSNCVQRQTELRASTFSHICTFVWSCQTMESSHLFKQNQCEIRTIPWGLSWTTQILWKV